MKYTDSTLDNYFLNMYFFVYLMMCLNAGIFYLIFTTCSNRIDEMERTINKMFMVILIGEN